MGEPLTFGPIRVDLDTHTVLRPDATVRLTSIEARLLAWLVANPSRTVGAPELLREVWGYRPGIASRTVKTTVHRLREKLEMNPAEPIYLRTVFGAGYRLERAPPEGPGLVGRGDDVARVEAALGRGAWVTLVGPAGVGKTTLARAVAQRANAAVFVPLAHVTRASDALDAVRAALGLDVAPTPTAIRAAIERPSLVVLDNLEQLDAGALAGLADLAGPPLEVLATSRRPTGVPAERTIAVDVLGPTSAERLFRMRADAARPGWDDGRPLSALLLALDHLPLAIELAAGRLTVLGLEALESRLHERLDLLRRPGADPRVSVLEEAIRWSWQLLQPDARVALAQLCVFEGGFDVGAAEAVVRLPGGTAVIDVVEGLHRDSLLLRTPGSPGVRFDLYESVRVFAAARLADPGPVRMRHAQWVAAQLESRSDLLLGNLRAVVTRESSNPSLPPELHARLVGALERRVRGDEPRASAARLEAALARPLPDALRAELLTLRGDVHRQLMEMDDAMRCLDEAVRIGAGDASVCANALVDRALTQTSRGAIDAALADAEAAGALARGAGAWRTLARAHIQRAGALRHRGRTDTGPLYEAAAQAARAANDDEILALALCNHGGVEAENLRLDRAVPRRAARPGRRPGMPTSSSAWIARKARCA